MMICTNTKAKALQWRVARASLHAQLRVLRWTGEIKGSSASPVNLRSMSLQLRKAKNNQSFEQMTRMVW